MPMYTCKLNQRKWLSDTTYEVELTRPTAFEFLSGQNLCFHFQAVKRYYAPLTSPADPFIKLCVYLIDNGIFSPVLAAADIGTQFKFSGPHGHFVFRPSDRRPIFVATGTGIVPFLSMARSGIRGFSLLHIVPRDEDLYYREYLEETADVYMPCIPDSGRPAEDMLALPADKALDYMAQHLPVDAYDFYLCGNQSMIRDVTLFVDNRYPDSMVYTEVFYRSRRS